MNENNGRIINGNEYKTYIDDVDIYKLKFYPDNPRVYSVLNVDEKTPSQDDIFKKMCQLESVKELKENIKNNGGLTDPIIIQDGTNIVLEGNSRLAAYRLLYKQKDNTAEEKEKWSKIRCEILPEDITKTDILVLLGQYHVTGKTNWDPYEQASYLYRWHKNSRMPVKEMATRLGLKNADAQKMINVIEFMKEKNDNDIHHYSHYLEYIAHKDLSEYRENNPELDSVMVAAISSNSIKKAEDIRKLKTIATSALKKHNKTAVKQLEAIKNGEKNIYDAYDSLEKTGVLDSAYKKLSGFRQVIAKNEFTNQLKDFSEPGKVEYELRNTIRLLQKIQKDLGFKGEKG